MQGEKGVCSAGEKNNLTYRTKFSTEKWAKEARQSLFDLRVIPVDYVTYKCKACGTWHIGSTKLMSLFGVQ